MSIGWKTTGSKTIAVLSALSGLEKPRARQTKVASQRRNEEKHEGKKHRPSFMATNSRGQTNIEIKDPKTVLANDRR